MKCVIVTLSLFGQLPLLLFSLLNISLHIYRTLTHAGMPREDGVFFGSEIRIVIGKSHMMLNYNLWPSVIVVLCFVAILIASFKVLE